MPSVVRVHIDVEPGFPPTPARVHGLVSSWLEGGLGTSAHRAPRKGFSVAIETAGGDPLGRPQAPTRPCRTALRIGLVDDALLPVLAGAINGGLAPGRLRGAIATDAPPMVTAHASWEDLVRAAGEPSTPPRSFFFVSHSGVAFRSGRLTNPLPLPNNVFGHLRRRWSEFGPPSLLPDIDLGNLGLVISDLEGRTEITRVRGQRYPGFVGRFTVHAAQADDRDLRVLDALARLAPFAGIGANTTVGMGRVEYRPR